ncbi:large ribosomal subunit protein uL1m-like [Branchiostoma floridae x Branchiostoma japonicum]
MAAPCRNARALVTCILRCSSYHIRSHWEAARQPCAFLLQQRTMTPYRKYSTPSIQQVTDAEEEQRPLKPPNKVAWYPTDDVYHIRYYPWNPIPLEECFQQMRRAAELEFRKPDIWVQISLQLDMKLEKKKKVEPFVGSVHLPHTITEPKKILVFATDSDDVEDAKKCGAHIVGGLELIQEILQDKVDFDYCVSVPSLIPDLQVLKKKLQKKFPKKKRDTVGHDIPFMVDLWSRGQKYSALTYPNQPTQEGKGHVNVIIGRLDMTDEQLTENIDCMIKAVCTHKPLHFGSFVTRALVHAKGTPAYKFQVEPFLPAEPKDDNEFE